jgi:DNA (cytosine-5)-methyltransferase 1
MDLGLERAGMKVVYHSEIDPYACRVLRKHWPDVPNLGDIKLIKWKELDHVDVIAGGYPCQPFSNAGKRKGKEDPRHLWPYVFDAIRELRPRYALMENVRGHLTLGFGDVLADLASCGYSAEWQIIPASSVGAPHRRDRLFFVAYPDGERSHRTEIYADETGKSSLSNAPGCGQTMAHAESCDERESESYCLGEIFGETPKSGESSCRGGSEQHRWETEPDVGRVAHGVPARVDRLRGLGNAVVPQVAEFVGRKIMEFESLR